MCVIVDANLASQVLGEVPSEDFAHVADWIGEQDGCLVYGGRLARELAHVTRARRRLATLLRAGRARLVPDEALEREEQWVTECGLCRSDDPHVVALARVSGARTLCTHDRALQRDFRNPRLVSDPRGSVYQRPGHAHLLRHSTSCGRLVRRRWR